MTTRVFTLYLQLGFYVWSSQLKQRRPKNLRSTKNYFCLLCDCCYAAQTQAVAVHIIRWAICISAFWLKNRVFNTYRLPIYHNASHLRVGAIIKLFFFFCNNTPLLYTSDSDFSKGQSKKNLDWLNFKGESMQPNFMYICGYVVYCFSSPVAQEIIHKIKCSSLGSIPTWVSLLCGLPWISSSSLFSSD